MRDVQAVDPRSHKVVLVGQLPVPLSGAVAVDLGGTVYLAGGDSPAGQSLRPTATIYAFDRRSHSFPRAGSLPVAVSNAGAAVLGKSAWIVGGEVAGGTPTATVQVPVSYTHLDVYKRQTSRSRKVRSLRWSQVLHQRWRHKEQWTVFPVPGSRDQ